MKREVTFYSDKVDRYFLLRNVTNDFVAQDKEKFYQKGKSFVDYHIDTVSVDRQSSQDATVSFVKHWTISDGDRTESGQTRSRLALIRVNAQWVISGEQDLK